MIDVEELEEAHSLLQSVDAISVAVGIRYYKTNHLFSDLYINSPIGRSPRLMVSRFYWDASPPVVVDMIKDIRFGENELAAKKTFFLEKNIRYVIAKDTWDAEGVEAALATYDDDGDNQIIVEANRPLVGPRRNKDNPGA